MQLLNVVLLQSDFGISQNLIASLSNSTNEIHLARSSGELRSSIVDHHAAAVILDLEVSSLSDVEQLSREFPGVSIVCNHRLADEEMWTATMNAGAADCCPSYDTKSIAKAALANSSSRDGFAA
jgi:DNA-binding NarL/FixJ family response regulator